MRARSQSFITYYKLLVLLLLLFTYGLSSLNAQCPTVTNSLQSLCDIESVLVGDLQAIDNGGGVVWYETATSTIPLSNSASLISGEDYYADDNTGTCGVRPRVDVIIYGPPTGQNFQGFCSDDPNVATVSDLVAVGNDVKWYLSPSGGLPLNDATVLVDETLYYADQANPDTGCRTSRLQVLVNVGFTPIPTGDVLQEFCATSTFTPTVGDLVASGNNNWYISLFSAFALPINTPLINGQIYYGTTLDPPCESSGRLAVLVVLIEGADAGTSGELNICSNASSVNLFDSLNGNPDAGGTWTAPDLTPNDGTFDPLVDLPGDYTYTVAGNSSCPDVSAIVTVTIETSPDAGQDNQITICSNASSVNLFNSLNGNPDAGGTWTAPDLSPNNGTFDPLVDLPGDYTYTVAGNNVCPDVSAIVTVTIETSPDAGQDNQITICSNTSSVNLFDSLNGNPDAGGTWTAPDLTPNNGTFDPLVDLPGDYTYTVAGNNVCPNVSAKVTVTIEPSPDAGQDNQITICSNASSVNLFDSLNGNPNASGTWTAPDLSPNNGTFDPLVDLPGDYTYTVAGTNVCPDVSAKVTVTIEPSPDAGQDNQITICSNSSAINLFDSLNGNPDAGGTWTAPDLTPTNGTFDPLVDLPGDYTYTVAGTNVCPDVSAKVTVTIETSPDAGQNNQITICSNASTVNLFDSLNGNPDAGGTWTAPDLTTNNGTFDPLVDLPGDYTYTVAGTNVCPDVSAKVTVTIETSPDAGQDNQITICSTASAVNLFDSLNGNPDAGGTWTAPDLTTNNGTFDPLVDLPGDYTYTVAGTNVCPDVSAKVTVTIETSPDAGQDNQITICSNASAVNLFDSLNGNPDAGGTWTAPDLTTNNGTFDPLVDLPGDYTYTVAGTNVCPDVSAKVTVTIETSPDAGQDNQITICSNASAVNLFDSLNGNPDAGGTWTAPDLTTNNGTFDPLVDLPGDYTYTVAGTNVCPDVSAKVTVTIETSPDAGQDNQITICSNASAVNLFDSLNGNPDAGGTWTAPDLTTNNGTFDPLVDLPGDYTYTVNSTQCNLTDQASVNIIVNDLPDVTGLIISVANPAICYDRPEDIIVNISGANQLPDGDYSIVYQLSEANISVNTAGITVSGGNASFTISQNLLPNPGITIVAISQFFFLGQTCSAITEAIEPAEIFLEDVRTPQLTENGSELCEEEIPTIANLTANIVDSEIIIWYDQPIGGNIYSDSEILQDGQTYYASIQLENGCESTIRLALTVNLVKCIGDLLIPDGFSPNGDTINDVFDILFLDDLYPKFKLSIYNRYGNTVYEGNINSPKWDGTWKNSDTVLPVGVYFYILEFNDGAREPLQGRVYLSR
ncbi:gliding motility-associated C-terminal domain-containing protein [Winogradskyella sp. R77965]|uniref:T9SS type B sorting domain-containing protein n=1 Tax=Winogradskyella sp. R77965 TaxID=3093872 RepID=UPI0037DDC596